MEIVTENALSLAWMGDAVMTAYFREKLLRKGYGRPDDLQKMSAKLLSARAQSAMLDILEREDWLSDDEKVILQRGKAARIHTKAKNADVVTYLRATALEAVLGYLYLYGHQERLHLMLQHLNDISQDFI